MLTKPTIRGGDGPPVRNDEDCEVGYKDNVALPVESTAIEGSTVLGPTSSWAADGKGSDIAVTRGWGSGSGNGLLRVRRERRQLA